MSIQAVIFDLDGVIVSTDEYHYQAWSALADRLGIPFGREDNERLRGVSRMESLAIILEKWAGEPFSDDQKERMASEKNQIYRKSLSRLSSADILPGVETLLRDLERRGIKTAIGSSSRNAATILKAIGLEGRFDAVADGSHITRSKPDPEVFILAAERLGIDPACCLVVEDAEAGVEAAIAAGMPVLSLGPAAHCPAATLKAEDLTSMSADDLLRLKVQTSC